MSNQFPTAFRHIKAKAASDALRNSELLAASKQLAKHLGPWAEDHAPQSAQVRAYRKFLKAIERAQMGLG